MDVSVYILYPQFKLKKSKRAQSKVESSISRTALVSGGDFDSIILILLRRDQEHTITREQYQIAICPTPPSHNELSLQFKRSTEDCR